MKIEKYHFAKGEALVVNGSIHFDYNFAFCGRPYIHLNAYCGRKYQIGVGIRDKWNVLDNCSNAGVYCSECGKKVYRSDYANQKVKSNFCPNCGAKMDVN